MKTKLLYALIILLVILHLVLLAPAVQHPQRFQTRDTYDYLDLAHTFLSTGKYAGMVYPGVDLMRPPAYPAFVMLSLWLGQGTEAAITILQVLLLFTNTFLLYNIGYQCGYPTVGLIAAIFYLLNPNTAFWSMMQMTEILAAFFLVLSLYCLVRYWKTTHQRWLFSAGLALSLGALTRPILLLLSILLGLGFLFLEWRRVRKPVAVIKTSAFLFLGILSLVLPWQLRNLVVHGSFTLSEVGESTFQNWYVAQTLASAEGYTRDEASALIAKSANPMRYSLQVIRTYPLVFVKEQMRGILRTMLGAEYGSWEKAFTGEETGTTGVLSALLDPGNPAGIADSLRSQAGNRWFWAGMYALLFDIVFSLASMIGLWKGLRYYRQDRIFQLTILVLLALFYLVIIPGVAGESRFRVPADPLLALTASLAWLPIPSKPPP